MDTSRCTLDTVVTAEPSTVQASRKVSYVNETGIELSIHSPCGEIINLPPRRVSCPRMVLTVYVTYTLSSTVGIYGITESSPKQTSLVVEDINGTGTVTLKYEFSDMKRLLDGDLVIIDPLNVAVYGQSSGKNLFPVGERKVSVQPYIGFKITGGSSGYVVINNKILEIEGDGTTNGGGSSVSAVFTCGTEEVPVVLTPELLMCFPFLVTPEMKEARTALTQGIETVKLNYMNLLEEINKEGEMLLKTAYTYKQAVLSNYEESESTKYKRDMLSMKNTYEMASLTRKDTSEAVKWGPLMMSGIGVAVGLML